MIWPMCKRSAKPFTTTTTGGAGAVGSAYGCAITIAKLTFLKWYKQIVMMIKGCNVLK